MSVRISRGSRKVAVLVALVLGMIGLGGSPASATSESSSPNSYTFVAVRTVDTKATPTFIDDVTSFTYTLAAAPGTGGGNGISHALFAAFCVTPTNVSADKFLEKDGSTNDIGYKRENIKIGDAFTFTFAGNYDADPNGARIVIKQGSDSRTVTLAGPACPAKTDPPPPVTCPAGEMTPVAGVPVTNVDQCVVIPCPAGRELPANTVPNDTDGDRMANNCVAVTPPPVTCPAGEMTPVAGVPVTNVDQCVVIPCPAGRELPANTVPNDTDGDRMANNCVVPFIPTFPIDIPVGNTPTCPDGPMLPTADRTGDGVVNAEDCTEVLPEVVTPTPRPNTPAVPAQPNTPGTPATPATPAQPAPSVLPTVVTPNVIPAVAPARENAVLGAQVQRAPLARTGSSSTGIAAFGVLLLALGVSSTLLGRRTART